MAPGCRDTRAFPRRAPRACTKSIDPRQAAGRQRLLLADTGSSAKRQQADLGGQGPRNTTVSFLAQARLSAPGHERSAKPKT